MIDYNKALLSFNEYIQEYDLNDANIKLKVVHTFQAVNIMTYLCRHLHLNKEDTEIARVIALLHDFGRFKQWQKYHSFLDYKTIDHAVFSCELLFDQGYIRQFVEDTSYDDLIHKAIAQHNRYKIEEGFSERELLFIHLIRDADKLDNFRVKETETIETLLFVSQFELEQQSITPEVYSTMKQHQLIYSPSRKTELDFWLSYIAFTYDLYFKESFEYVNEYHWIERSFDRVHPKNENTRLQYLELRTDMLEYVKNKISKSY